MVLPPQAIVQPFGKCLVVQVFPLRKDLHCLCIHCFCLSSLSKRCPSTPRATHANQKSLRSLAYSYCYNIGIAADRRSRCDDDNDDDDDKELPTMECLFAATDYHAPTLDSPTPDAALGLHTNSSLSSGQSMTAQGLQTFTDLSDYNETEEDSMSLDGSDDSFVNIDSFDTSDHIQHCAEISPESSNGYAPATAQSSASHEQLRFAHSGHSTYETDEFTDVRQGIRPYPGSTGGMTDNANESGSEPRGKKRKRGGKSANQKLRPMIPQGNLLGRLMGNVAEEANENLGRQSLPDAEGKDLRRVYEEMRGSMPKGQKKQFDNESKELTAALKLLAGSKLPSQRKRSRGMVHTRHGYAFEVSSGRWDRSYEGQRAWPSTNRRQHRNAPGWLAGGCGGTREDNPNHCAYGRSYQTQYPSYLTCQFSIGKCGGKEYAQAIAL